MPIFAVSRVQLDADGRVTGVLWGRVNTKTNEWESDETAATVREVVRAIQAGDDVFALFPTAHGHLPERRFMVVTYDDGRQTVALDGPTTHEREIHDMDRLGAR